MTEFRLTAEGDEKMNTDLKLALGTTVVALLMILAFSLTAILH